MVRIMADSTCDLSKEIIQKYDISIVPLYVRLGEEEYKDGLDITPEELYKWSDENGETPKTAAPSIADYESVLSAESDDEYIIFTISSSMSGSYNNARLAAEDLDMNDRVYVIDSANLSTGIGLLILEAAEMAGKGIDAKTICDEMERLKPLVRSSFVVDTLTFLHRGGRCSGAAAFMGNALKLHPRIAVSQGAMHPEDKYRGSARKYIIKYVKDMHDSLLSAKPERVFITHSGCDDEILQQVRTYLKELDHFGEILETRAGGVISSHCGPGTLGVLFIAGERETGN